MNPKINLILKAVMGFATNSGSKRSHLCVENVLLHEKTKTTYVPTNFPSQIY
jgi:hypothetical protein